MRQRKTPTFFDDSDMAMVLPDSALTLVPRLADRFRSNELAVVVGTTVGCAVCVVDGHTTCDMAFVSGVVGMDSGTM